jgi:toxin ParE1/3/4
MKIKWLKIAIGDINQIMEYISKDIPKAAKKIAQIIWDNVNSLRTNPNIGRPGRVKEIRELIVNGTPFIIPYRIKNEEIQILRIFHSSRKWPDKF